MKKQTIINFLKETAALITYCLIINVVLATFYLITDYINLFYLIDLGTNVGYIIGYTMIMCIVLSLSILIEPYKFTRSGDERFIRNHLKISAKPNYFSEIPIYLLSVLCTFMLGLALGTQGPSLYVGILTALLVYKFIFKTSSMSENEQIILGGSVGFSIAFFNPLAGMTLALERSKCKLHLKFVFKLIFSLVFTFFLQVLFRGDFVCDLFIRVDHHMNYWLLFVVPVFVLIACTIGVLFKKLCIYISKHINHDNKIVKVILYSLVIIIPVTIKVFNPWLLGGGTLTLYWLFSDTTLSLLAIYGAIRIIFTLFSFETKFSGGLGGSIIIMGAILGRLMAGVLGLIIPLSETDYFVLTIATALPFYGITSTEKYTSLALMFSFGNFIYLVAPVTVGWLTMFGACEFKKFIKKHYKKVKNSAIPA